MTINCYTITTTESYQVYCTKLDHDRYEIVACWGPSGEASRAVLNAAEVREVIAALEKLLEDES